MTYRSRLIWSIFYRRKSPILKGFRDFIMRGNAIDLAVGVVIGSAFTAAVTAFTDNLLEPLLNTIDGVEVKDLGFEIISDSPSTYLDFAAVITTAINFLLVAAVVYFAITAPMNKFNEIRGARLETSTEPEVTEVDLLTEIRGLLAEQSGKPKTKLN